MRRRSPAELIVGSLQLGLAFGAANRPPLGQADCGALEAPWLDPAQWLPR
jgi:hypothetical protein